RDSCSDLELLVGKLKLNFGQYVDGDGHLQPDKAKIVLAEIELRRDLLDEIKSPREREYFRATYDEFVAVLLIAIEHDKPIYYWQ
ncbi:MAG: hypothetical protein ACREMY_30295, partial [bacterium]